MRAGKPSTCRAGWSHFVPYWTNGGRDFRQHATPRLMVGFAPLTRLCYRTLLLRRTVARQPAAQFRKGERRARAHAA